MFTYVRHQRHSYDESDYIDVGYQPDKDEEHQGYRYDKTERQLFRDSKHKNDTSVKRNGSTNVSDDDIHQRNVYTGHTDTSLINNNTEGDSGTGLTRTGHTGYANSTGGSTINNNTEDLPQDLSYDLPSKELNSYSSPTYLPQNAATSTISDSRSSSLTPTTPTSSQYPVHNTHNTPSLHAHTTHSYSHSETWVKEQSPASHQFTNVSYATEYGNHNQESPGAHEFAHEFASYQEDNYDGHKSDRLVVINGCGLHTNNIDSTVHECTCSRCSECHKCADVLNLKCPYYMVIRSDISP